MRHRMRCCAGKNGCHRRFNLRKHPSQYVNPIRCPHCKSLNVRSEEKTRRIESKRRKAAGEVCNCDGYPFPHAIGTMRFCVAHPLVVQQVEPTDIELMEYNDCLSTPRGGFT